MKSFLFALIFLLVASGIVDCLETSVEKFEEIAIDAYVNELSEWAIEEVNKINKQNDLMRVYSLVRVRKAAQEANDVAVKELELFLKDASDRLNEF